jgi:hypothetical protein
MFLHSQKYAGYINFAMTAAITACFFVLPYLIFGTTLHIGGDDSRLFYYFPDLWLKNVSNSTWTSFSSTGAFSTQYYLNPLLMILNIFKQLAIPAYVVQNSIFSLIFVAGFVYFRKFIDIIRPKPTASILQQIFPILGALIYILSPILLLTTLRSYLANIFLIPLIPAFAFWIINFYRTQHLRYLATMGVVSFVFAVAFNAIPWTIAVIMVAGLSLAVPMFHRQSRPNVSKLTRSIALSTGVILATQMFWLLPFAGAILSPGVSVGSRVFDPSFTNTYYTEVQATSKHNSILDPVRNLFHQSLQEDFNWPTKYLYDDWYARIGAFGYIYILVIILALLMKHKQVDGAYNYVITGFLISLFLFTVNIGALRGIFLSFGEIPGFVMFRNFYDKFSLVYVFFFAAATALSLERLYSYATSRHTTRGNQKQKLLIVSVAIVTAVTLYNAKPLASGEVFTRPLRNAPDIGQNIHIPKEYLNFMNAAKNVLPSYSNVFNVPFGNSAFTIISDPSNDAVYAGKSPFKLFTGVNDFSGKLAFPPETSETINRAIEDRNYHLLKNVLSIHNINYLFETSNIPNQVLQSHLYRQSVLQKQDEVFKRALYGEKLFSSEQQNYQLYRVNGTNLETGNALFVAKTIYTSSENLPTQTIYNIADANHVYLRNVPDQLTSSAWQITPFTQDMYGRPLDAKYDWLYITGGYRSILLNYNSLSKGLETMSAQQSVFLASSSQNAVQNSKLSSADVIRVGSNYYLAADLNNIPATQDDSPLIIYTSDGKNLIPDWTMRDSWQLGDCNAHNDTANAVSAIFSETEITLSANDFHNACIFTVSPVKKDALYLLRYNYQTNVQDLSNYIDYSTARDIKLLERGNNGNEWGHAKFFFTGAETGPVKVYMYSGKHQDTSIVRIQDIELLEYHISKELPINSLFSIESSPLMPNHFVHQNLPEYNESLVTGFSSSFPDWNKGDCGAVNAEKRVEFLYEDSGNTVTLTASDGHNACIYQTTAIVGSYNYNLSFDYLSEVPDLLSVYVDYGKGMVPDRFSRSNVPGQWLRFKQKITPPAGVQEMTIYLYSGKAGWNETVSSKIQQVTLTQNLKIYDDNLLLTSQPASNTGWEITDFKKEANHQYTATIQGDSGSLLLNFIEPYHEGWALGFASASGSINYLDTSAHVMVNDYSNGWVLSLNDYCLQSGNCKKESAGQYSARIVIQFMPQKLYYIGISISTTVTLICLLYLLRHFITHFYLLNKIKPQKGTKPAKAHRLHNR